MLQTIPLVFVLIGLTLYVVLGGADFGAAAWQATTRDERLRAHAHDSMAPVWEANHVWLIFVLTVLWTAYPEVFGSIASTLSVALFLAGIGIIVRGFAYAVRSGASTPRQVRGVDTASAISSVLTPFALGAAAGGIASGRVPVGNAAGDLWSSWLNPTSIVVGALAVAFSVYLAAVFLAADAARADEPELVAACRTRALAAGSVAGVLAVVGLVVLRGDARPLFDDLVSGGGLAAIIVSALFGVGALALVARGRYEPSRYVAAVAVAATIAGWALAQQPDILPGLTIQRAAAPDDTLVAVIVAVLGGGAILFPSLVLLFRLTLGGMLGHGEPADLAPGRGVAVAFREGLLARAAVALLIAGFGLLTVAGGAVPHALGVASLLAFVVTGFLAAAPALAR
ncbi:cytochrome d ubiquinol oxidase subunit II [Candidatus Solirubrobacter pratensis]|uniref:cytochrome d ubiquinol oxidase subunit II n=1 Tax=Candidatus Solirubrobacter pratensis TaxID=1298857 RepID=UPI0004203148|nr:cytochrome d ubiquinol oxidase subunit II [Candidatus Solirubrobacter pratensis]